MRKFDDFSRTIIIRDKYTLCAAVIVRVRFWMPPKNFLKMVWKRIVYSYRDRIKYNAKIRVDKTTAIAKTYKSLKRLYAVSAIRVTRLFKTEIRRKTSFRGKKKKTPNRDPKRIQRLTGMQTEIFGAYFPKKKKPFLHHFLIPRICRRVIRSSDVSPEHPNPQLNQLSIFYSRTTYS